jgi:large subunit ribosomal protein L37Ae
MAKKTKLGSTKRFGPRYGRKNREKVAALEKGHRGKHKCPFCNYIKVVRLSKGIWHCTKCDEKFAGKAYTYDIPKKTAPITAKKKKTEEPMEEEETYEEEPVEEELEKVEPEEKPQKTEAEKKNEDIPPELQETAEQAEEERAEVA